MADEKIEVLKSIGYSTVLFSAIAIGILIFLFTAAPSEAASSQGVEGFGQAMGQIILIIGTIIPIIALGPLEGAIIGLIIGFRHYESPGTAFVSGAISTAVGYFVMLLILSLTFSFLGGAGETQSSMGILAIGNISKTLLSMVATAIPGGTTAYVIAKAT